MKVLVIDDEPAVRYAADANSGKQRVRGDDRA